jgi:hypothetical protein
VTVSSAPQTLVATSSAGSMYPVTFSTTSTACSISGTTLTVISDGTCSITASQAGDGTYAPATLSRSIAISKLPQTITFTAPTGVTVSSAPQTLVATSSAGSMYPVTFSTTSTACSISGTTLTVISAGTCSITATQAGGSTTSILAALVEREREAERAKAAAQAAAAQAAAAQAAAAQAAAAQAGGDPAALAVWEAAVRDLAFANALFAVKAAESQAARAAAALAPTDAAAARAAADAAAAEVAAQIQAAVAAAAEAAVAAQAAAPADSAAAQAVTEAAAARLAADYAAVRAAYDYAVARELARLGAIAAAAQPVADYASATNVVRTITIAAKLPQTISFRQPSTMNLASPDQTLFALSSANGAYPIFGNLSASAASAYPITFRSTSTACTISAGAIHAVAPGVCSVVASQSGDDTYAEAMNVVRTIYITESQISNLTISNVVPQFLPKGLTGVVLRTTGGPAGTKPVIFRTKSSGCKISGNKLYVKSSYKPGVIVDCTIVATKSEINSTEMSESQPKIFRFIGFCDETTNCVVGDMGPGGGFIIYSDPETGFACGPNKSNTGSPTGGLCHYLEVAPTDVNSPWTPDVFTGSVSWTDERYDDREFVTSDLVSRLGSEIGSGYSNTLKILAELDSRYPGGNAIRNYRGPNNYSDWYLPSKDELSQFFQNRSKVPGLQSYVYTSSSKTERGGAWTIYFNRKDEFGDYLQGGFMRPIRAF